MNKSFLHAHTGFEPALQRCWSLKSGWRPKPFRGNSRKKLLLKIVRCHTNATSCTMSAVVLFSRVCKALGIQTCPYGTHATVPSSRGRRTKCLAASLMSVSVSKNFARSVNATRRHSVKGPTGSNCNTTPVLLCDRENTPKPGIGNAPVVLEHAHQPMACANIVWKQAFARKDLTHVWRLHTFSLLHSSHGTSPLGVHETLCGAVRLARNLRRGLVLAVGDVVDQRFCLGES